MTRAFRVKRLLCAVALLGTCGLAPAQSTTPCDTPSTGLRDGSHDFDFSFGSWTESSSRLLHPLTGSKEWIQMQGRTVIQPIWGGKANIAEFEGDGPKGHLELIALRIYNPTTHQWSLNFATSNVGRLGEVPGVGEFKNGRIDFYDQEPLNGRQILVRFSVWSISSTAQESEQAYSDDGGKTWEVNWINHYTRVGS